MPDTENVTCPRCGFEQPSAMECARCGVIFAKVRNEPPKPSVLQNVRPVLAEPGGGISPITWLLFLVAIGLGSATFLLGRGDSVKPASPLPGPQAEIEDPAIQISPSSVPVVAPQPFPTAEMAPREVETPEPMPVRFPFTWYEGNRGYLDAMEEAAADGKPLAVYFYTDWCPYCRELDGQLLADPHVQDKLRYLVKVRINPERGAAEKEIARRYGVRGYPSFFVQPSAEGIPTKIAPLLRDGDGWYLRGPEDFSAVCWRAARL